MAVNVYGDISPRTAAFAVAKFLRYEALPLATTPLVEGVTPQGKKITYSDVTATLNQYGDFVTYSDVIQDTHEDNVPDQIAEIISEQAAQTIETIRFNIFKAGTNVFYLPSTAAVRTDVTAALTGSTGLAMQRKITRAL